MCISFTTNGMLERSQHEPLESTKIFELKTSHYIDVYSVSAVYTKPENILHKIPHNV